MRKTIKASNKEGRSNNNNNNSKPGGKTIKTKRERTTVKKCQGYQRR